MRVNRKRRAGMVIAMTPLVDVMLIMLIFFMVTSTYLDLDMIPLLQRGELPGGGGAAGTAAPANSERDRARSMLIRLAADGSTAVSGRHVGLPELGGIVADRLAGRPGTRVLVLPSGAASTQALVSLMDALTLAGALDVRVVRLEAP